MDETITYTFNSLCWVHWFYAVKIGGYIYVFQFPLMCSWAWRVEKPNWRNLSIPFVGFSTCLSSQYVKNAIILSIPFVGFFTCKFRLKDIVEFLSIPFVGFDSLNNLNLFYFCLTFNSLCWVLGANIKVRYIAYNFQFPLLGSFSTFWMKQQMHQVFQFPLLGSYWR